MSELNIVKRLPHCAYPTANDTDKHGFLELPKNLTKINWAALKPYRTSNLDSIILKSLTNSEIIETANVVASSFVKNEPIQKHLKLPKQKPNNLAKPFADAFGENSFGEWSKENLFYWVIRLAILSDTGDNMLHGCKNEDTLNLSLAVKNKSDQIIGGMLCSTLKTEEYSEETEPFRFTIFELFSKSMDFLFSQEHKAISALSNNYSDFSKALNNKKVGIVNMIAKANSFPKENIFELFAQGIELFHKNEYEYVVVAGSNQWTGAACEVMNGTRVHYNPYRDMQRLATESTANIYEIYSEDGYLSAKDSGVMFYILKL